MPNPEETREATIAQIRWERDGNPWKLLRMSNGQTWKGLVGDVLPGTLLKATGRDVTDQYGTAFEVSEVHKAVVDTVAGVEAWLIYRLPQIGEERARALVEQFDGDLFDIIKNSPQTLTNVRGITAERAQEIHDVYMEYEIEQLLVTKLVNAGLKIGLALKAYKKHKPNLEGLLDEDPYELMDVEGINFAVLDPVALNLGVGEQDPRRIRAYARARLEDEMQKGGHCWINRVRLTSDVCKWGVSFQEASQILRDSHRLTVREGEILLRKVNEAEQTIALRVLSMLERETADLDPVPELPDWLDDDQKQAVLGLLTAPVSVMTGGPGTGKTTVLETTMDLLEGMGALIRCAAPTGKAAKRMSEVTGRPASTIHRLLKWSPDGWRRDAMNPLEANVVIVDEASMVDVFLAAALFDALGGGTRLIIVGDADQLPPVGPGQVLFDLIQSGRLPLYRLRTVHRQKGDSWVCDNAYKIIDGKDPNLENTSDFVFGNYTDSDDIAQAVIEAYQDDPEIQVLTPEHKNGAGTQKLNRAVQAAINPKDRWELYLESSDGHRLYEDDKIIYTRNNADLGLVNGDIGTIINIKYSDDRLMAEVKVDGLHNPEHPEGLFQLCGPETKPMTLAYALTVHKSQGSEWANVIIIADKAHWSFRRQLLYTAVTRTFERLTILGSEEAIQRAVRRERDTNRRTLLQERLNV